LTSAEAKQASVVESSLASSSHFCATFSQADLDFAVIPAVCRRMGGERILFTQTQKRTLDVQRLDKFVARNMAWSVVQEPTGGKKGDVVIERAFENMAQALEALEVVQYPPDASGCRAVRTATEGNRRYFGLMLMSHAHSWYDNEPLTGKNSVPFMPIMPTDWAYVDENAKCTDENGAPLRQLQCLFLPATGCNISSVDINAIADVSKPEHVNSYIPTHDCPSGQVLWTLSKLKSLTGPVDPMRRAVNYSCLVKYAWQGVSHHSAPSAPKPWMEKARTMLGGFGKQGSLMEMSLFMQAFMRPNYEVRAKLKSRLDNWRRANPGWGAKCVALHVRRGDKVTDYWVNKKTTGMYNRSLTDYGVLAKEMFNLNQEGLPNGFTSIANHMAKKFNGTFFSSNKAKAAAKSLRSNTQAAPVQNVNMFLITDDADTIAEADRVGEALGINFFSVPPGRPLVSVSAVNNAGI
jgi:hypothetical protein